jgi:ComF family protein
MWFSLAFACLVRKTIPQVRKAFASVASFRCPKRIIGSIGKIQCFKIYRLMPQLIFALAYFYYSRKSKTANILHAIKYKNKPEMARMLGKLFGQTVVSYLDIQPEDVLVPIPLHPSKLLLRGYNQSACLAEGISEATGIPVFENVLIRKHNNASQTRKSRENRWKDSDAIFEAISTSLPSQRVILVDDVYTTGATLVAASKAIVKTVDQPRLGVLTLARSRE